MNGFGTARHRQLPVGLLSAGWADGNRGENLVVEVLAAAGVAPRFNAAGGVLACHQQYVVGPYTLDRLAEAQDRARGRRRHPPEDPLLHARPPTRRLATRARLAD